MYNTRLWIHAYNNYRTNHYNIISFVLNRKLSTIWKNNTLYLYNRLENILSLLIYLYEKNK